MGENSHSVLSPMTSLPTILSFLFQIPGAPDDEAVRIFLEFERVESAIKGKLYS